MDILVLLPTEEGKRLFRQSLAKIRTEHNYKVVQCGIGKVDAAITTTMELMHKDYDLVVLSGFCGSSNTTISQGSVVLPSRCVCYDFYNIGFDEDITTEFDTVFGDGSIMLTGDQFVNSSTLSALKSRFPNEEGLYFDMESSGVCQACSAFNIRPLIVKLVADFPENGDNLETFRTFVSQADFDAVVNFIDNFTKDGVFGDEI